MLILNVSVCSTGLCERSIYALTFSTCALGLLLLLYIVMNLTELIFHYRRESANRRVKRLGLGTLGYAALAPCLPDRYMRLGR